ncbi:MAG TPA: hypothetical protein VGP82_16305 [Ktedonobacterales bacterium]|nr:hypothetical protein [Ktedonobacterales bacterium]
MSTRDINLSFCGAVILIPVVLIIMADSRARSGYGLMWLTRALMGLTALSVLYYHPGPGSLAGLSILGALLEIGWDCTLVLWLGALVEAGMARVGLVRGAPARRATARPRRLVRPRDTAEYFHRPGFYSAAGSPHPGLWHLPHRSSQQRCTAPQRRAAPVAAA